MIGTPNKIKSSLIEEYLLIDAVDKNKLENELKKLKLNYQKDGLFKINLKNEQEAQKVIQSIKTPLKELKTHSPTLEEAYLEIIGGSNQNGGNQET
jgi:ABC-2 type transport system ATP-binding protein